MIATKQDLIARQLQEGTGASIAVAVHKKGLRSGLRIWFDDLHEKHGPVATLQPYGLKGHRVELTFGNFSGAVLGQIRMAAREDVQLARALIASIGKESEIVILGQSMDSWLVLDGSFRMVATKKYQALPDDDQAITETCKEIIVPMMAAMAELIGYDEVEDSASYERSDSPAFEGVVSQVTIRKRERNPRNRLLCIRIHGENCAVCNCSPRLLYGDAGGIIEVHHLEPLSNLHNPRPYDPVTDLVPLCPNCHRALHTRRPVPWTIEEMRSIMSAIQ